MQGAMIATPLYAALLALWVVLVESRRTDPRPTDFTGYLTLALLLLLVLELSHFSIYVLHLIGVLLVLARLLSAYAWARTLAMIVIAVEAVLCLYQAWKGHLIWFTT